MAGVKGYHPSIQNVQTHRRRIEHVGPPTPELDREMILYWLRNYPKYRETIRQRISEAAKKAEKRSNRFDSEHKDVDYLGRDIDGCG